MERKGNAEISFLIDVLIQSVQLTNHKAESYPILYFHQKGRNTLNMYAFFKGQASSFRDLK